jgi:hypothetical protein
VRKLWILGIVFMFLLSLGVSADIETGLISEWLLDETTGTTAEDNVGTYDGTANNARIFTSETQGIRNTGADFTQGNDYINVPYNAAFNLNSFTFSAWVYLESLDIQHTILYRGDVSTTNVNTISYIFRIGAENKVHLWTASGSSATQIESSITLSTDTWYHVVGVLSGTSGKIYINGIENASGTLGTPKSLTQPIRIGNRDTTYADAVFDEIRIYNVALSASDVKELFEYYNRNFQIKAKDIYDNSTINNFNATITNSTDTTLFTTSNGSIYWQQAFGEILNLSIASSNYFNKQYANYNITLELEAELHNLVVVAKDLDDNSSIDEFTLTYDSENFSTMNGTLRTNLDEPTIEDGLVNVTLSATDFYDRTYTNHNTTDLLNASLWNKVNNFVEFRRMDDNTPLDGIIITTERPDGSLFNLTTNSSGRIQFDFQDNQSVIEGTYTFTFPATVGFITPISFNVVVSETNPNIDELFYIATTSIRVNIFDRATFEYLEKPVDIIFLEMFNVSTSNGTYVYDNITLSPREYTVQTISEGYDTEQLEFLYTGQENLTLNFYMLNLTDPNAGTLFVSIIDDFYRVIQNAGVTLLEYNTESKSYIQVSECRSNSNGECAFTIELNKKTYIVKAEKEINGVMNYANTNLGGEIIKTDNEVRNLVLRPIERYTIFPSQNIILSIDETFENNISTIYIEYSTLDNAVSEVCVEYFLVNDTRTSVYEQCVTSSSSYTATPVLLDRINNYEAEVYLYYNGIKYLLAKYEYPSEMSLQEILGTNNLVSPVVLFFWIVLIAFALKTENMTMFIVGGLFLAWGEWALFPSVINASGSVLKTAILIFMYYTSRKREDFQ